MAYCCMLSAYTLASCAQFRAQSSGLNSCSAKTEQDLSLSHAAGHQAVHTGRGTGGA